ncbi:DnaJ subfamily C member 17 [Blattella germanica]|nr:DnaJ subfamily C member 17 [Blattella germanica]
MADLNINDVDLYDVLGILSNASVQEIKKAYRKKALTCHPDKNPDNPRAAELFHELSKALEILTDESARAAYDKVLNAKKAAKLRHRELDSKRQKLKEELEARERLAEEKAKKYRSFDRRTDEEKLQAEIERLRKEGSKQVEEEQEIVRQQIIEEMKNTKISEGVSDGSNQNRLKVRWEAAKDDPDNGGYSKEILQKIFSKYGDIMALIISSKRKGSALVEFKTKEAAIMAEELERGLDSNPLKLESLVSHQHTDTHKKKGPTLADLGQQKEETESGEKSGIFPSMHSTMRGSASSFPSFSFSPTSLSGADQTSDTDFENLVLRRMRQAQERKKLIEEMQKEDEN